jgi:hypothetical protein
MAVDDERCIERCGGDWALGAIGPVSETGHDGRL